MPCCIGKPSESPQPKQSTLKTSPEEKYEAKNLDNESSKKSTSTKKEPAKEVLKESVKDKMPESIAIGGSNADPHLPQSYKDILVLRNTWETNKKAFYDWHSQTIEEVIDPELEIVDPHHHLWDMRMLKGFNLLGLFKQQYYMAEDLIDDILGSGHNVTHTVFTECHAFTKSSGEESLKALGEVQFVQGIAAQFESGKYSNITNNQDEYGNVKGCAGIIGGADLGKFGKDADVLLKSCKEQCPNFKGIRCCAHNDPDFTDGFKVPNGKLYSDEKFREGFALLEKYNLTFDAHVFSSQLFEVIDLATAFPNTSIILDHQGSPLCALGDYDKVADKDKMKGKQNEIIDAWKSNLKKLADSCPNVFVKLGGLVPGLGHGFDTREKPVGSDEVCEKFGPLCLFTIETFGTDRCMFESNFPVDKCSVGYRNLWNAYKKITKDLSAEDRVKLFSGTAKRVYGLE